MSSLKRDNCYRCVGVRACELSVHGSSVLLRSAGSEVADFNGLQDRSSVTNQPYQKGFQRTSKHRHFKPKEFQIINRYY